MKTIILGFCLAVLAYGIACASEVQHAVIVDMPEVATLRHASPDTWHTLAPVQPKDVYATTALMFAQLEATCPSRISLSLVEFF